MQAGYLTIAALVLASACAKSEEPAPNKNTNWLRECSSDDPCGDELACLCGICTIECDSAAACAETDDDAVACGRAGSAALRGQCASAASFTSVCVAA